MSLSRYENINDLLVTIECSDGKKLYYYKRGLYGLSRLFQNIKSETGIDELIIVPFKSNLIEVFLVITDCNCGYMFKLEKTSLQFCEEIIDVIDYFDVVRPNLFYDSLCNAIAPLLFKEYIKLQLKPRENFYHDIKPCIRYMFEQLSKNEINNTIKT